MPFFNRKGTSSVSFDKVDARGYHDDFVQGDKPHTLLDVRTTGEFMQGHLPGAVNIPLDQLANRVSEVPSDKPVVVVCASGNRSQTGAKILLKDGFTDVYNLSGGTFGWMMQGFPVEN